MNDVERGAASGPERPSPLARPSGRAERATAQGSPGDEHISAGAPAGAGGESPHKGATGLARLRNALRYSLAGLRAAFRHEDAFRQEVVVVALLTPAALLLAPSGIGRALLIGSMLTVLVVELVNSAIEAAVDRISYEDHRLAKRAKDIGSAAVFVAIINAAVVWGCVLLP